ncbi:hypothetical protein EDD22DRAFT_881182 [Suillus occidentalis]|nr:hypothetical protein EDD22DRAFT_881182 [Suillus occidentalis]
MFYTRRPPTLSINELNHIISESLDIDRFEHVNVPDTILHDPLPSTPEKQKTSTFHRFPRKMTFTWRLSRLSPNGSRRAEDCAVEDIASAPSNRSRSSSVCSVTSAVLSPSRALTSMSSTSSLGSVIPTSERFSKLLAEEIISTETGNVALSTRTPPSPSPVTRSRLSPTKMAHSPPAPRSPRSPRSPLQFLFGNKSSSNNRAMPSADVMEKWPGTSATECNIVESIADDVTPRATEFAILSHRSSDSTVQVKTRRRPSALALVLPPQEIVSLCLQPAIGVSPYVPSDTEGSVSVCSFPSPTTSIPTSCQPSSYVPLVSSSAVASSTCSTKSIASTTSSFPFSRARAGSRVMLTPPLPGPPPSSPLPPLPNLTAQNFDVITPPNAPVPLPPINRTPSKRTRTPVRTESPLSTVAAPPSPGSLRLPSRLSWGATGRMVVPLPSSLPSPPSSPSKVGRKRELPPCSPTNNSMTNATSPILGKRTSIGILEAAGDLEAQVRRTKSILVLGTRRSKGTLSCKLPIPASPPKKPRRKSSAACTVPFLAVPRERRRSAPLLRSGGTSKASLIPPACADWTLSLPFCIDIPGSGICVPIPPSEDGALHEADEALQVAQGDDWTLSLGADRQNLAMAEKVVASQSPLIKDSAEQQISVTAQLPTPSTTPEPDDDVSTSFLPALFTPSPRPDSPASLGPHGGGLDLDGGCGKRGSGWDACGWFEVSSMDEPRTEDTRPISILHSEASWIRRSCDSDAPRRRAVFTRRSHPERIRSPSEDSTTTSCTVDTLFYSARTSIFVV